MQDAGLHHISSEIVMHMVKVCNISGDNREETHCNVPIVEM
jgi:hypothetical protein